MFRKLSLLALAVAIFLIFIFIRSASPPSVRSGNIPDSCFSVKRAFTHLEQISRLPHFTGTIENSRVREYIDSACRKLGFTVEIQNTTSSYTRRDHVFAGNIYNIIATKKGSQNSKSVLLMAHYDSQLNTPAAGDDGAAVAAMLETARALQKNTLQNDLILLFTDAEETGMMGANAFVKESPLMKEIGVVINFEGRGNAGPSNMFEINNNNGWAVNEYATAAAHPFANSLGYEIYKKLPNYTDFTPFKKAGITGLNNAYIDGFVNYHSANDRPENLDLRSFQHHGDNMLSLAKHFGNVPITETKAPDASYFNLVGNWFIHYPASWNLFFVILADLLFISYLFVGVKNKKINPLGCLLSVMLFPAVTGIIFFAAKNLLKFIIWRYPLYTHFDVNNSYNSAWYFLAMSALAATIFSFVYFLVAKKISSNTLLAGILLTFVVLMNGMQYAVPSGSYLLFFPLIFILTFQLFALSKNIKKDVLSTHLIGLNLLSVVPAICFLAPFIYFSFIAFALGGNMPFIAMATGMCMGLLLPVVHPVLKNERLLLPLSAFGCFLGAMLTGHLTSGFSEKHPLPSSVRYAINVDSTKAKWLSDFASIDKWSAPFFKGNSINTPASGYNCKLINDAPVLPLLPPMAVIGKDTVENGKRKVTVDFNTLRENVVFMNIEISTGNQANAIFINGKQTKSIEPEKPCWHRGISYTGLTKEGFNVTFEMEKGKTLDIVVSDRSIGLPAIPGLLNVYPKDIIPGQGSTCNTTQVRKHFVF
ncbi:MAG: M20/M25/M40 family metallo-hydrolase [Ferruginibacter sp.]